MVPLNYRDCMVKKSKGRDIFEKESQLGRSATAESAGCSLVNPFNSFPRCESGLSRNQIRPRLSISTSWLPLSSRRFSRVFRSIWIGNRLLNSILGRFE